MNIRRQELQGIENWRGIEKHGQKHFPDNREIAKFYIEWCGQKSKAENNDIGRNREKKKSKNRPKSWHEALDCKKENNHD